MKSSLSLLSFLLMNMVFVKPLFAADRVYKTYQNYVDRKPEYEEKLNVAPWMAFVVKGYDISLTTPDGEKIKIPMKDIWGFEQEGLYSLMGLKQGLTPETDSVFLCRVEGNEIYRRISKGKFNCWVLYRDLLIQNPKTDMYSLLIKDGKPPACYCNTKLEEEFAKMTYSGQFFKLTTDEEKEKLLSETKIKDKAQYSYGKQFAYYVMQAYNQVFTEK